MSWDIYGNGLRPGYCEVHPSVHEYWPCSFCRQDAAEAEAYRLAEAEYYREQEEAAHREAMAAPSRPCPNPLCKQVARLLGGIWTQECTHKTPRSSDE